MSPSFKSAAGLVAVVLAGGGCAGWFMNGAELQRTPPKHFRARFRAPSCEVVETKERIEGVKADYYLAADGRGPVLYELESKDGGAAFRNAWSDSTGQHFFGWVTNSHGWQFTFPREEGASPTRFVFGKGTYSVKTEGGTYRPVGEPLATCALQLVASEK